MESASVIWACFLDMDSSNRPQTQNNAVLPCNANHGKAQPVLRRTVKIVLLPFQDAAQDRRENLGFLRKTLLGAARQNEKFSKFGSDRFHGLKLTNVNVVCKPDFLSVD